MKPVTRDEALASSPRIKIETPYVAGSINLQGAQLDDLHLLRYRETIDPKSPTITFLSPSGTPGALFAEQGFVPATGTLAKLPDATTLWTAPAGAVLTESNPVILTWDNGEGLVFSRKIEISDEYVFTVTQTVENKSAAPVALIPYARIQRQDTPCGVRLLGVLRGHARLARRQAPGNSLQGCRRAEGADEDRLDRRLARLHRQVLGGHSHSRPGKARHRQHPSPEVGRPRRLPDGLCRHATPSWCSPARRQSYRDQLFAGAKVVSTVNAIGTKYSIAGFDYMIDWGWFYFLTKPMFYLLDWLKGIVGNFGIAILLATVLVKLAVFPLANKSYASMSKMKKLQPEMEKLKLEYPDDKMAQQKGMMELYKREKVSPLSGCLARRRADPDLLLRSTR